jgi:hypothetical protein
MHVTFTAARVAAGPGYEQAAAPGVCEPPRWRESLVTHKRTQV